MKNLIAVLLGKGTPFKDTSDLNYKLQESTFEYNSKPFLCTLSKQSLKLPTISGRWHLSTHCSYYFIGQCAPWLAWSYLAERMPAQLVTFFLSSISDSLYVEFILKIMKMMHFDIKISFRNVERCFLLLLLSV